MKITTLLTKFTLVLAFMLGINTSHADDVQCPPTFTPPDDLSVPLNDEQKAEQLKCTSAYMPMIWNTTYTVKFFKTYCTIKKGTAYGFTIKTKKPDVISQKECERIGGFMQCYETLKACHQRNDTECSTKSSYCTNRLANLNYDPEKDPDNTEVNQ